ncbi:MAG: hypothetical protein ACOYNY_35675 [Caldilineaceae bacterium]
MQKQEQVSEETMQDRNSYAVFLLRIWRSEEEGPWRVALIKANGEEIRYFASLAQLFACLWQELR